MPGRMLCSCNISFTKDTNNIIDKFQTQTIQVNFYSQRASPHFSPGGEMRVAGDQQHGLNVLVDHKSRLTPISLLENKTAASTKKVMTRRLKAYPVSLRQSMTYANGSENI